MKDTHVKIGALSKPTAVYLTNLGYEQEAQAPWAWFHPEFDDYPKYDTMFNSLAKERGAVVSDGGSSSYYTLDINGNKVETEEIISQVFGNDFDFGNAFKSLIRAYGATLGKGKAGNDIGYELNKIDYSINKIRQRGL